MLKALIYILTGYLLGSVLCARLYARLYHIGDPAINSRDHNPETRNAFRNGGLACGAFTFAGDFLKAFIPVYLYTQSLHDFGFSILLVLVMAAPVIGNDFSCFNHFRGGRGVAASLGALFGTWPYVMPACVLQLSWIFFSGVLVIKSDYYRTMASFMVLTIVSLFMTGALYVQLGAVLIGGVAVTRLLLYPEQLEKFEVVPVWKL